MQLVKRLTALIMSFLVITACGNDEKITAFKNVNLVPMTEEKIVENQTVLVKGDRIIKIGPSNQIEIHRNAQVIEGQNAYLMPGLADMHVHLRNDWPLSQLDMYLVQGVTTIRDMGGKDFMRQWREEVKTGKRSGPTIYVAAPIIYGYEQNPADLTASKTAEYDFIKLYSYFSKQDFQTAMQKAKQLDLYTVGHIPYAVGLDGVIKEDIDEIAHLEELIFEFVDFDRNRNLQPDEWLPYIIKNVMQQNIISRDFDFDNLSGAQKKRFTAAVNKLKSANIPVCTTMVIDDIIVQKLFAPDKFRARSEYRYLPPAYKRAFLDGKEKHQVQFRGIEELASFKYELDKKLLVELHRAGVPLVLGTDAGTGAMGIVPGAALHDELLILVKNGFTPYEAIKTGTVNASKVAAAMTGSNDFGSIEVGKRADLILVNHNPLENIEHIRDYRGVMSGGKWYERAYLKAIVDPALIPGIPFVGMITNVHEPDATFRTYVDLVMLEKSKSNGPDDIEEITVTGPQGDLPIGKKDFIWLPQFKEFWCSIPGSPAVGTYTFSVTGGAMTGKVTDFQSVNRNLPIPISEYFSPANEEILSSREPNFSWDAIETSDIPIFYRLTIWEAHSEKRVYATGKILNMLSHKVPAGILKSGESYRWRVEAGDNQDWLEVQNRSNSKWQFFTMAETLNDFEIIVVIKNTREPDDNYFTHLEVLVGKNFKANLPDSIDSIVITGPKGRLPVTKADFTYYPQFRDFFVSIPGSPEAGRYSFTVTGDNLKASATDIISVLRSLPTPGTRYLAPAEGAVIRSKIPTFSWNPVEYHKAPVYYRIEIWNPEITERAYSSHFEKNMLSHTLPAGTLKPGKNYKWRVRVTDSYNWERSQNRANGAWQTITIAQELE
ncbi:MAG: amidohydrolase family protein [Deltaproteobacteria bacterium]|nr:amidohydrolase family protein [Deltaproteobacteria bacterium]